MTELARQMVTDYIAQMGENVDHFDIDAIVTALLDTADGAPLSTVDAGDVRTIVEGFSLPSRWNL